MKPCLLGFPLENLTEWVKAQGFPAFRARQIHQWLYGKTLCDPGKMGNLPEALRRKLKEDFFAPSSSVAEVDTASDGVEKLAVALHDGECIEMVVIPSAERMTFCLSTQVGCPVGCVFCASGKHGFTRNLSAGEMLEEFVIGCERAGRPDNLVFMGIGEGLMNFDALAATLDTLTAPDQFALSPRRITVSTSGYIPGMKRFAQLHREFNLAVSLHAVNDEIRARLIPPACRYPVAEILAAADACRDANGRQYTLEYTLVADVNDDPASAKKLGEIALAHHAKINLIPCNATEGVWHRPDRLTIENFEAAVAATGARVTRRVERGSKKTAACGQLRSKRMEK